MADSPTPGRRRRLAASASVRASARDNSGLIPVESEESADLDQLRRENELLRKQVEDERRLRREAEDIIDERQDEIYNLDMKMWLIAEEQGQQLSRLEGMSGTQQQEAGHTDDGKTGSTATPAPARTPPPRPQNPIGIAMAVTTVDPAGVFALSTSQPTIPDLGLTRAQAAEKYSQLLSGIKSFIREQLSPVFEIDVHDLDPAPISRLQPLLYLVRPRARRFLGHRDSESVHFTAIIMEFLFRYVFSEPYGGLFTRAVPPEGLPPPSPSSPSSPQSRQLAAAPVVSEIQEQLNQIDDVAERMAQMLLTTTSANASEHEARVWRAGMIRRLIPNNDGMWGLIEPWLACVEGLTEQLAHLLLPVREVLAAHDKHAVLSQDRQAMLELLETAVRRDIVEPAVSLALEMALAANTYEVRWVHHDNDSPSLTICEGLGRDFNRIRFRAGSEPNHYFLFDISPGLFMGGGGKSSSGRDNNGRPRSAAGSTSGPDEAAPSTVVYAQGILLSKNVSDTQPTLLAWLDHGGYTLAKPKGPVNFMQLLRGMKEKRGKN